MRVFEVPIAARGSVCGPGERLDRVAARNACKSAALEMGGGARPLGRGQSGQEYGKCRITHRSRSPHGEGEPEDQHVARILKSRWSDQCGRWRSSRDGRVVRAGGPRRARPLLRIEAIALGIAVVLRQMQERGRIRSRAGGRLDVVHSESETGDLAGYRSLTESRRRRPASRALQERRGHGPDTSCMIEAGLGGAQCARRPSGDLSPTDQLWPNGSRKPPWRCFPQGV
jgi:hypothetical protein